MAPEKCSSKCSRPVCIASLAAKPQAFTTPAAGGCRWPRVSRASGGTDDKLRYFVDMKATRLRNVEQAWAEAAHAIERIVFTP